MKKLILFLVVSFHFTAAFATNSKGTDFTFLVKPYVYSKTGNSIRVAWSYKTSPSSDSQVQATFTTRLDTKPLAFTRDAELFTADLPIPTCGFATGNMYFVSGMEQPEEVTPIPCPSETGASTKIIFMADTQVEKDGVLPLEYFVKQIKKNGDARAIVIGGDLTQVGRESNLWTQFFNVMNPLFKNIMLVPVMGNHEYHGSKDVPLWQHYFGVKAHDAMYSVVLGDAQIFVINSCFHDDPSLGPIESKWLEGELKKSTAKWKIVTFHHPPYSSGIMNTIFYPKKEYRTVQKLFVPLFEKYKVDLVLNGHVHIFERSEYHGVNYLIMGAAAGQMGIFGNNNEHSLMAQRIRSMATIDASEQELVVTTTDVESNVVDLFTIKGWQKK